MENKTFEQLRKEQLALLSQQLTISNFGGTGKGRFIVYPFEANLGKTHTIIKTLESMYEWQPNIKSLVVSKFIDEGIYIANSIPNAIAVNSKKTEEQVDEDDLEQYSTVVITHQKYKMLCKDYERRQKYTKGRKNLIIDEELNLTNMDIFSTRSIYEMETILKEITARYNIFFEESSYQMVREDLGATYRKIISGLENAKNEHIKSEMKFFYFEDQSVNLLIDRLKELIKGVTFADNYINHLKAQYNIYTSKDRVLAKLEMLKKFYNNPKVIVSAKTLYTYDNTIQYFTLDNNIILDASAKFNTLYRIADKFKVIDADRIVDHGSWTVHLISQNSTAQHKHHNDNYYKDVVNLIRKFANSNDRILILGLDEDILNLNENYSDAIADLNIEMENFHAMRGKNLWEDFNKCFIIHNPAMNYAFYAFEYMLYSGNELTDDDLYIQRISKNMGYKNNPTLEDLRKTDIVSNIYQGVKRINRGMKRIHNKADVYIINSDEEIHKLVVEQLNGAIITYVPFNEREKPKKTRKQKGYKNEKRKANSSIAKLAKLLSELDAGSYKKGKIASMTNYSASNISKLLKRNEVKSIIDRRGILVKDKEIIIP